MRMLLNLYEDKVRRIEFESWGEDEEKENFSRQNKYYNELIKATPIIMKVYQENLEMKERIDTEQFYQKESSDSELNIKILRELESKINEAIHQRTLIQKRFDMLCMWKGMNSDQISLAKETSEATKIEFERRLRELEEALERVNIQSSTKDSQIESLEKKLDSKDILLSELNQSHAKAINNYESRLNQLKSSIEQTSDSQLTEGNSEATKGLKMETIRLNDQIKSLQNDKEELLTQLQHSKDQNTLLLEQSEIKLSGLEIKIKTLVAEKTMLSENLSSVKSSEKKLSEIIESLRNESSALTEKLRITDEEKSEIDSISKSLAIQLKSIQEDLTKNEQRHHSEIAKLKMESEKLRQQVQDAEAARDEYKEEMDTMQISVQFMTENLSKQPVANLQMRRKHI